MPIAATDIDFMLSGGASNTDPTAALGGAMSTTTEAGSSIFDNVTSGEASAGDIEYRCVYVRNNDGTRTYQASRVFIQANTPNANTDVAIGLGTSAVNGTEQTVANENTAPTGVTFVSAVDFANGIVIGDLAPAARKAIWIRRTVTAGATSGSDGFTLRAQGDSVA